MPKDLCRELGPTQVVMVMARSPLVLHLGMDFANDFEHPSALHSLHPAPEQDAPGRLIPFYPIGGLSDGFRAYLFRRRSAGPP
jgi:hypothetical protein